MLIFTRLCASYRLGTSPRAKAIRSVIRRTFFGKSLILTNSFVCGTLMLCGDAIQQQIEKYRGRNKNFHTHDWERSRRMFIVGLIEGPPQHYFYGMLDFYIPSTRLNKVALKILLDQLIGSPMCLLIFFFGMGLQEGHTVQEIFTSFKQKFRTIYTVDLCVWPLSQFINFYFLLPKYRVIYISFITMLYNCFLSFIHFEDQEKKDEERVSEDHVSVEEDDPKTELKK